MSLSGVVSVITAVFVGVLAVVMAVGEQAGCTGDSALVGGWSISSGGAVMIFDFQADGTVLYGGRPAGGTNTTLSGTYSAFGNEILMHWTRNETEGTSVSGYQCATYSIDGSTMEFSISSMATSASAAEADCGAIGPVTLTRQDI